MLVAHHVWGEGLGGGAVKAQEMLPHPQNGFCHALHSAQPDP